MLGVIKCDSKDGVHKNIGDPIQTLAALQFAGDDALLLERERLDVYDGPEVNAIMNAYYMHDGHRWPPSEKINPLMLSIHINPTQAEAMLSSEGVSYFKCHEPIGCRDKGTQRLLEEKGVKAYFSGCLTLTLGETVARPDEPIHICFVDPYFDKPSRKNLAALARAIIYYIANPKKVGVLKRLAERMAPLNGGSKLVSLARAPSFYRAYSTLFEDNVLLSAEYISHSVADGSFRDEREKIGYAKTLLKKYAASRFVVTSRIHCALPCVGIGTPVIFVDAAHFQEKASSRGRFDGNLEFFNTVTYVKNKLLMNRNFHVDDKIDVASSIPVGDRYKSFAASLADKSRDFVRAASDKVRTSA